MESLYNILIMEELATILRWEAAASLAGQADGRQDRKDI